MNKDSNIRVFKRDRSLLRKIAKKEGRTLKVMFGEVLSVYSVSQQYKNQIPKEIINEFSKVLASPTKQ